METPEVDFRRSILWFVVSTALLLVLIYVTGFESFWRALSKADLVLLLPAFVLGSSVYLAWGFTWYRIFRLVGLQIPYIRSLKLNLAAVFLNNVTPLGQLGGEPLMAYVISSSTGQDYEEALSYVVSADFLNIIPSFTFIFGGAVYMVLFGSVSGMVMEITRLAAVTLAVVSAVIYVLWFRPEIIEYVSKKILGVIQGRGSPGFLSELERRVSSMAGTLSDIGDEPGYHAKTAAIVHLGFLVEVTTLYIILLSLGFNPRLLSLYFVLPLTDIALFTPSPGGMGTYEALLAGLLTALTPVGFSSGLVAALIYRLFTFWTGTIYGYIMFNTLSMDQD